MTGYSKARIFAILAVLCREQKAFRIRRGVYKPAAELPVVRFDSWSQEQIDQDRIDEALELSWLDIGCRAGYGI